MSGKVNLERWEQHLKEARRLGLSVAQHARQHAVSVGTLYAARQMVLRRYRARKQRGGIVAQPFIAVQVPEVTTRPAPLHAQLPNGVGMEMLVDKDSAPALSALVLALGSLPCSG